MSLSQSVKDFFINKISMKLQDRITAIEAGMNKKMLEKRAFDLFVAENGLEEVYDVLKNQRTIEQLKKENEAMEDRLYMACKRLGVSVGGYAWTRDVPEAITLYAKNNLMPTLIQETYPDETAQIEELRALQSDVEGVVLLATTPTRLRESLKSLLDEYGAQLDGIEKIVEVTNQ